MKQFLKIFLYILLPLCSFSTPDLYPKIEYLTNSQNLSIIDVKSVLRDSYGFMWFGTMNGLYRYDGYSLRDYKNITSDSTSLVFNWVTYIYEDSDRRLWISTRGGLCRFDRLRDKFIRYPSSADVERGLASNIAFAIYEDRFKGQKTLWINTIGALHRYQPESDSFRFYTPEQNRYSSNQALVLKSIAQDSTGKLWIGTFHEGLFYFNRESDRFLRYEVNPGYKNVFNNTNVTSLITTRQNSEDFLWAGSNTNGGLFRISLKSGEIRQYLIGSGEKIREIILDKSSGGNIILIGSNAGLFRLNTVTGKIDKINMDPEGNKVLWEGINCLYQDRSGLTWVGTADGIYKLNFSKSNFTTILPKKGNPNSLSDKWLSSISLTGPEEAPVLWIATYRKGLNQLKLDTGRFRYFRHIPGDTTSLTSDAVREILRTTRSDREELWVVTEAGFNLLDPVTGRIKRYYVPEKPFVNGNIIWRICEDGQGNIWLGLGNRALYLFNPVTETFTRYPGANQTITDLYIDSYGIMWIGSVAGLIRFEMMLPGDDAYVMPENYFQAITRYYHDPVDKNTISYNFISDIYEDRNRQLWIGTANGLNKYNREKEEFTRFDQTDGLPGTYINAILEDDSGNLWLGTDHGIAKFNPKDKSVKNYDAGDGLQGNVFTSSAYKSSDGYLYFGGSNGLTYFHPDRLTKNLLVPNVVLTGFRIFNKPIFPGPDSALNEEISLAKDISLPYDQSVFSFEFAALDYHNPQKNKYAYIMEGVDPDWVYTDASRRFATYTNLDPGEYTFRVRASNNDDIWNEEGTSIRVTILPPWWKTNWAYSIYLVMFFAIAAGAYRFQSNRLKIQRQMEIKDLQAQHLQEMDRVKSRFFTNISHEFRTPLTLIKGPLQQFLKNNFAGNIKEQYRMMLRNTNRLLELVNQILDISKLESGQMKLIVAETNIVQVLKEIALPFAAHAESRKIKLRFNCDNGALSGYIDRDKFTKMTSNLISNAIKNTPEAGVINVNLVCPAAPPDNGQQKNGLHFSIANTGPGIPAEDLERIFDRFYQAGNGYRNDSEGSGIGLALVRELVELHHGKISAASEPGKQTVFSIWLPVDRASYMPEEIMLPRGTIQDMNKPEFLYDDLDTQKTSDDESIARDNEASDAPVKKTSRAPRILVVEDNPDVIRHVTSILNDEFRIADAGNGSEGLKQAIKLYPDLIVSDVMMPEMDGYELCRRVKTDQRISHIPVILLTAKADMDSKIDGLEFGADDYLSKPFDADELRARIRNLIKQRQMLREKFSHMLEINPAQVTATSLDEQFLERVITVFENHISDPHLDTVKFAREVGISRSQLNRKLMALTNQPTSQFLVSLRLKRAAQLIRQYAGNITEIAYTSGFQSLSHFSKKFREHFGETPSQYAKKSKQKYNSEM